MRRLLSVLFAALLLFSCSTTKMVPEGEYRLKSNEIKIDDEKRGLTVSSLSPYIKQKAAGWNPMLYVYNWSSGKGRGWDKFVEKIGQAPVIFDSTMVIATEKSLASHLDYAGFYNSTVSSTVEKNKKKASVRYNVELGTSYVIDSINFQVSNPQMAAILVEDSSNFTVVPGKMLSEEMLESESERLASLYRNNGYFGFTKNYFFFSADTTFASGHCNLDIALENYTRNESPEDARPHRQYTIGSVKVMPKPGFKIRQSFVDNLNKIEPGDLYSEEKVKKTYNRFTSIPVISSVDMEMKEVDSTTVDCLIKLTPSKLQSIKFDLEASYNSNSLFGIAPAITYVHKNIFGSGEVLNFSTKGNYQFKFSDNAQSLELTVAASLTFPKFLIIPNRYFETKIPRTEIYASYNFQNRPEYTREIWSLNYGYLWNFGKKVKMQFYPARINGVKIYDMTEEFKKGLKDPYMINAYSDHLDIGGSANVYFATDPASRPEHSYFYVRWQNNFAGNVLSLFNKCMPVDEEGRHLLGEIPYSQYYRTELSLVETLRFGEDERLSLAGRLLVGVGLPYGNSSTLPFEQLFYSGGASSLRGWQARSVGPGSSPIDTSFVIKSQSGDMRLEANLEFRFPLFWKLEGGLFADAGNVWLIKRSDSSNSDADQGKYFSFKNMFKTSAMAWGVGLRLDFNMILVRVDMGIKAYDPVTAMWRNPGQWFRDDGYSIHFGIGYPF